MKKFEFSKFFLLLLVLPYFLVIGVGVVLVLGGNTDQFGTLCAFVGAPVGIGVGFYFWKAKAENIEKIARNLGQKAAEKVKCVAEAVGNL